MGYSGLSHWVDSDNASDMIGFLWDIVAGSLDRSLTQSSNEFNTDGVVDVALFFEAFVFPIRDEFLYNDEMMEVATKCLTKLEEKITEAEKAKWDTEDNKKEHINAYKRMAKHLGVIVEEAREANGVF